MIIRKVNEIESIPVTQLEYKGKKVEMDGVKVKWLVHKAIGDETYLHNFAVRYFEIEPGSVIPTHEHKYVEAVYILQGELLFKSGDEEIIANPNEVVYVPSFEKHSLENIGDMKASLICCIDCHGDKANCLPPNMES